MLAHEDVIMGQIVPVSLWRAHAAQNPQIPLSILFNTKLLHQIRYLYNYLHRCFGLTVQRLRNPRLKN